MLEDTFGCRTPEAPPATPQCLTWQGYTERVRAVCVCVCLYAACVCVCVGTCLGVWLGHSDRSL